MVDVVRVQESPYILPVGDQQGVVVRDTHFDGEQIGDLYQLGRRLRVQGLGGLVPEGLDVVVRLLGSHCC